MEDKLVWVKSEPKRSPITFGKSVLLVLNYSLSCFLKDCFLDDFQSIQINIGLSGNVRSHLAVNSVDSSLVLSLMLS